MTKADDELEEYGKRLFAPLRHILPMDLTTAAQEKNRFLKQAEALHRDFLKDSNIARQQRGILDLWLRPQARPFFKAMAITLIVLVFLLGSSFTVYAAQSSLPGEPLYSVKSWSEDIRLSLTTSTQGKLNLILEYTNRREGEIRQLAEMGKTLPAQTQARYQGELDSALQLAAEMSDTQMHLALGQIKQQAEKQGMTLEELISTLPPQAEPAITHLQERLQEQINISAFGENDPQAFRLEMRARRHGLPSTAKKTPGAKNSSPAGSEGAATPQTTDGGVEEGNEKQKSTQVPGHGNQGTGGGNPSPGNGKHGPEPTP